MKQCNQILLAPSERVALRRHERPTGSVVTVFVESGSSKSPGQLKARTMHNIPVRFEGAPELVGEASPYGLVGVAVPGTHGS